MKIRMMVGAMALIGMTLYAADAAQRTYPCHRLAQAPALDGKMNDAAWKNIPEATGFYIYPGTGKYAFEKQTFFKAGWTEDAIYLAVRAEECTPEKLIGKAKSNANVWSEDNIELFFVPTGASNYTQLVASSAGSRYNGRGMDSLNGLDWEVKAVVGKTEWSLELRIPFAALMAAAPKEGDAWPVNAARNILTGPAGERFTCWPLLTKGFNETPSFGHFVFKGPAGDKTSDEENEINGSYIRDMQGEIKGLAGLAGKYAQELAAVQKCDVGTEKLRAEAKQLQQVWEQVVKASQAQANMLELRAALQASVDLQQKSDDCIDHGMLEALFME